jgi:hypothetical protein
MDLLTRLRELELTLAQEADLLHQRLVTSEKKRHKLHLKK